MKRTYRAGAIGAPGTGNFGHGLDVVFKDLPGVEFVAVADENPEGLRAAGARTGVKRLYADYREMLAKEKLDVVSVGPRWVGRHREMVEAAAAAGCHIYCEKPLARSAAEADRMLEACRKAGVKVAVAHQNRACPPVVRAKEVIEKGGIGKLVAVRARGKEDPRGGGEDLMVLGTHMMDLMRLLAGEATWAFGQISVGGKDVTSGDGRSGPEEIGRIAGDAVVGMYGFASGAHGYFESHRSMPAARRRYGMEIYGTQGILCLTSLGDVLWYPLAVWDPADAKAKVERITIAEWEYHADHTPRSGSEKLQELNQRLVKDLLAAAEEGREPTSSGADARAALEMIQAIYDSHLSGGRVALPLVRREHPLGE